MSNLHPIFKRILDTAPHAPPVICRRCDAPHDPLAHTLPGCERQQIDAAMLAEKRNGGRERRALNYAPTTE